MTRVLHVAASARGAASISRRVAGALIAALSRDDPRLSLVERDLAAEPPPHPDATFAAPSALKAWIDYVVRPDRTFRVTPTGKVGLLIDRPILAIVACGGRFDDGRPGLPQVDHLGPYLRTVFATVGLTDFQLLRLEQLRRGSEAVDQGLAAAGAWIEAQRARLARAEPVRPTVAAAGMSR
jgi:FMN-dependent NADH-azoreductase